MKKPIPVLQVKIRPGSISAGVVNIGSRSGVVDRARGLVESFTASSRSRLLSWLACAKPSYRIMVTLTLPHVETDGALFKEKLDRFLVAVMKNAPEHASVTWFLEFQRRGAPHVHMLTNFKIKKDWVSAAWARLWKDRLVAIRGAEAAETISAVMEKVSTRVEWLRSAAVMKKYATKYSAKTDQKDVPENYTHVGRFWGIRGDRTRVAAATYRKQCYGGFSGFPGDVIRLFWIRFNRFMTDKTRFRVIRWSKGVGVTAYFDDGSTQSIADALRVMLREFDFEEVICDVCVSEAK